MNIFTGEPEPEEVRVAEITVLRDPRDARVMRVTFADSTDAEPAEATVVQPGSVGGKREEAAQAVADRLNFHYPPDARLELVRSRDKLGGEFHITGSPAVGLLATEPPIKVRA